MGGWTWGLFLVTTMVALAAPRVSPELKTRPGRVIASSRDFHNGQAIHFVVPAPDSSATPVAAYHADVPVMKPGPETSPAPPPIRMPHFVSKLAARYNAIKPRIDRLEKLAHPSFIVKIKNTLGTLTPQVSGNQASLTLTCPIDTLGKHPFDNREVRKLGNPAPPIPSPTPLIH